MTDIVERLGEVGDWVSDKEWHQHPIAAEAQREIARWRANHKDVVETKRGTDARLKTALAGLQQIYTMCGDDAALASVRQIAGDVFETATKNLPRSVWQYPQERADG